MSPDRPPIASPNGPPAKPPSQSEDVRVFRLRFWRMASGLCGLYGVLLLLIEIPSFLSWELADLMTGAIGVLIVSLVTAGLAVLYPVKVAPGSIVGFTFWGIPIKIFWDDIQTVKGFNWYFGLPTIRIFSRRGGVLWLTTLLRQQQEFETLVTSLAPEGNPLRLWFENRYSGSPSNP